MTENSLDPTSPEFIGPRQPRRDYHRIWKRKLRESMSAEESQKAQNRKAEYDREYRQKNKERRKQWALNNPNTKKARRRHYLEVTKIKGGHGDREIYVGKEAKLERARELYRNVYKARYRERLKERRIKNADKLNAWHRNYYRANKEKISEAHKIRSRKRRAQDPLFRLVSSLRTALGRYLTGKVKAGRSMELIGCTREELRTHLEAQFTEGMSWSNYGRNGWHVDHIIPITFFDLFNPEHQRECFFYKNLQPMWAIDNIRKGNRWAGKTKPLSP